MSLEQHVAEYLSEGKLMQLATQEPGALWMCHVWFAHSPDLRQLVFTSNKARKHSKQLEESPLVSGGVVAINLEGLGQKVRGVVFSGKAVQAQGDEIALAYELYASKWPVVRSMFSVSDIEDGTTAMRMFIVRTERIVLWDEVNYPDSPRQELTFS